MNIVMLTNTYLPHVGGVARSVESISNALLESGHSVLIIAPEFPNMSTGEPGVIRVPAIQNFNGTDFSVILPLMPSLVPALKEFKPDIVHSHHPFLLGDTALHVAAQANVPLIFTHHTMYERYTHYVPGNSRTLKQFVIDLATGYANLCQGVIAPSESIAAVLKERGVISPLHVIPTGIDIKSFEKGDGPSFRAALGVPHGSFVIGHVGRLATEKNLIFLSRTVRAFMQRNPNSHFLCVGEGPLAQRIKRNFRATDLNRRIHMPGNLSGQELINAYHTMDIFAFSSFTETQGLVLCEAMACSVPVIALDAPGSREVVRDGRNGFLLERMDERAYVGRLEYYMSLGERERKVFRRHARGTAHHFSLQQSCSKLLNLYEKCLQDGTVLSPVAFGGWETSLRVAEARWDIFANRAAALKSAISAKIARLRQTIEQFSQAIAQRFSALSSDVKSSDETTLEPGLVLVQIDGLSRTHLERAMRNRKLPFLRQLLARRNYSLATFYSGLPSTTPAVQGELLYGKRGIVPAFGFYRRADKKRYKMIDPIIAQTIQNQLHSVGEGLVKGGSSYSNIFDGGAAESHFCSASFQLDRILVGPNVFILLRFLVLHWWSLLRAFILVLIEFVLAVIDCIAGALQGRTLSLELSFIPSRIGVSVLLREMITAGVINDIGRGLPIIHLNFLGYDEQAHRRGPGSQFAYWALRGIDNSINRIYQAAKKAKNRNWQVWIYSDHGQESSRHFYKEHGIEVTEGINSLIKELSLNSIQSVQIVAVGPLGHIYLPGATLSQRKELARLIASRLKIPIVFVREFDGTISSFTPQAQFKLPKQGFFVLDRRVPYYTELLEDLVSLCNHPDAGDIIISGWRKNDTPLSFAPENGAHGGPGSEETNAFLMLPFDIKFEQRNYLRPGDLRRLVLTWLDLGGQADTKVQDPFEERRHTLVG